MKLQKVPSGWYVEPETSTEQEHLRYLLEGLAARTKATLRSPIGAGCATRATGSPPPAQSLHTAHVT